MMKTFVQILVSLSISVTAAHATRVLEILERSYELALSDVTLPQTSTGAIAFKACERCARESMPVSNSTRYLFGGREVTLPELRQEAARIKAARSDLDTTMVGLHYDPETKVATRIHVETL